MRIFIKWLIRCSLVLLFILVILGALIYFEPNERLERSLNYYFLEINNATNSDIKIIVGYGKKVVTKNVGKNLYESMKVPLTRNNNTFSIIISAGNNILFEDDLYFPSSEHIGTISARGGLFTRIDINKTEDVFNIKFNPNMDI